NVTVYENSSGKLQPVGWLEQGEVYSIGRILGNWIEIQYGDKKGYVWKEATEPSLQVPRKIGETNLNTNVYFKASQDVPVYDNSTGVLIPYGKIKKGISYPIIKKTGNWYQILYASRIGYVYETGVELQFTDSIKYFETTQNNVQIVQNINGRLAKIGLLEKGQQYERLRDLGNWHEVQVGDKIGYVWKAATKPILFPTYKNHHKGTVNSSYQLEVTADATVYDNTSGKLVPIATLLKGAVYPYYEKMGNWYKVSVLGRDGYIYGSAVKQVVNDLVNPNQIYTYEQMEKDINELKNAYPGLIQTQIIGQSVDGRNIYAIKLGKGNVEIFLNGAHHAREFITTNLLMEMIDTYAQAYVKGTNIGGYSAKNLLDKTSIWFVPMVNPDGVTLVQKGHTSAKNSQLVLMLNGNKKDFSAWKANIRGVDLNRQYPADWANIKYNPGKPSYKNYKGPRPLSEPEAYAIYQFTNRHNFKTAVAYHSSGEILYWNFHQDSVRYNRDHAIAKMIKNKTGYRLVYPGPNPSGGGFTDWFISAHKKPGFTPEVSPYVGERPVPLSNFPRIWQQNYSIGLMLADEAYRNRNNR
ncbi:M14 family metallopeptidase, partial [Bacillus alveayuensis]|uniref:M14 family metallopeptidase n=1 Tax=Aeribacillus alveayuensis TaxID=279215 RepID=UPI000AA8D8EC